MSDVEITGMVNAKWVRVEQPEPGFLVELAGEKQTMTTFMTDEAMINLIGWCAHELKDKIAMTIKTLEAKDVVLN
jgi:hypothetical protein